MDLLSKLGEWSWAVFLQWEWVNYGFIGAFLLGAIERFLKWKWPNMASPPWYVAPLALVAFVIIGSFVAWNEKDRQLHEARKEQEQAQKELNARKPVLVAGFYNAYCSNGHILALMYIRNTGGMPSPAYTFSISSSSYEFSSIVIPLTPERTFLVFDLPHPFTDQNILILTDETIQRRSMVQPIQPGFEVRGWLLVFPETEQPAGCRLLQDITVEITDILGGKSSSKIQNIVPIPPLPPSSQFTHFPDIKYPFLSKKSVESVIETYRKGKK